MTNTFLTVDDAARALAVSPYTLREWLKTGKVRGTKIGTQWRVPSSVLDELAKGNNAPTEQQPPAPTGASDGAEISPEAV